MKEIQDLIEWIESALKHSNPQVRGMAAATIAHIRNTTLPALTALPSQPSGEAGAMPIEYFKIPGDKGSSINDVDDATYLEWQLKQAMENGKINEEVSNAFENWYKSAGITLSAEEKNVASIIFLAGMKHKAATTPPLAENQELWEDELTEALTENEWKSEYNACMDILKELVSLKQLKDENGKTIEYERRQPLAWERARIFLGK